MTCPYAFTLDDMDGWFHLYEWLRDTALVSAEGIRPTRDSIAWHCTERRKGGCRLPWEGGSNPSATPAPHSGFCSTGGSGSPRLPSQEWSKAEPASCLPATGKAGERRRTGSVHKQVNIPARYPEPAIIGVPVGV